jgi:hypothetical protein
MVTETVTPMIRVPDVRATVDWYRNIGVEVTAVRRYLPPCEGVNGGGDR